MRELERIDRILKLLEEKWKEYIRANEKRILLFGFPIGKLGKLLYKLKILERFIPSRFWISLTNQIRCEAHNDVIKELLLNQVYKIKPGK